MQRPILTLFFLFVTTLVFGQTIVVGSEILSPQETSTLFTDSLCKQFDITYPIRRVYKCTDKSGLSFIVLTESNDTIIKGKDTLHFNIKAYNFQQGKSGLLKKWVMNDFITKPTDYGMDFSIWFWTKYCEVADIDNDSLIDPIIIYGTGDDMDFTNNALIKFLIYYKGQKVAIRHQNGSLDFERHTQVDESFYSLPLKLQDHVKQIIEKMTNDDNAIFPAGWQDAMKKHKLKFDER